MPQATENLIFRAARMDVGTVDKEGRSFPIVLATETPVEVFIQGRGVVPEVLQMRGLQLPDSRQVPMDDTHTGKDSVRSMLGSIRDLKIEGSQLTGRAVFGSDPQAAKTFQDYVDGHLTDFSVWARPLNVEYTNGKRIVSRSRLLGGSAVTVGADPNARAIVRRYSDPHGMRADAMNEELLAMLIERGLPETATEAEAKTFLDDLLGKVAGADDTDVLAVERKRISDIDSLCRSHKVTDSVRRKLINDGASVDEASTVILRQYQGGVPVGPGQRIEGGTSEVERVTQGIECALTRRCLVDSKLTPATAIEMAKASGDIDAIERASRLQKEIETPAAGFNDFRYMRLPDMARAYLQAAGISVAGLPVQAICRRAMSHPGFESLIARSDDGAYHSNGSFPSLMLNAANKTLLQAWDEALTTYQQWVRQAPSASDYKELNRIRFGELDDPMIVPAGSDYSELSTGDSKEKYSVDKVGGIFSVTLESVVNDDLNAISRIPQMQGSAMRRKINRVCYAQLTANGVLSDEVALFHANHANIDSTTLSTSGALGGGFKKMMKQSGVHSSTVLNIIPRFLIVPVALSETALSLIRSIADPEGAHSGVANLYGMGGPRTLVPVIEPQLDLSSEAAWYLAAQTSQCDTVEITFLQGEETPVLEQEMGFMNDAVRFKIRQSFAAKAIDYRGLYRGGV